MPRRQVRHRKGSEYGFQVRVFGEQGWTMYLLHLAMLNILQILLLINCKEKALLVFEQWF